MKKIVTLLLLLTIVGALVFAQNEDSVAGTESPGVLFPDSIGFFGSLVEYFGLSWQSWAGRFGYAITAGGLALPNGGGFWGEEAKEIDFYSWSYNIELDLLYKLFSSNINEWFSGDLFVYSQLGHRGYSEPEITSADEDETIYVAGPYRVEFMAGLGVGFETVIFRHFSIPIMLGYVIKLPLEVNFNVGLGLRYRF